jgi:hypothetical protein
MQVRSSLSNCGPVLLTLEDEEIDHFGDVLRGALRGVGAQFSHAGGEFLVRQPGQKRVSAQGKLIGELLPVPLRPAASNKTMISAADGKSALSMGRTPGKKRVLVTAKRRRKAILAA